MADRRLISELLKPVTLTTYHYATGDLVWYRPAVHLYGYRVRIPAVVVLRKSSAKRIRIEFTRLDQPSIVNLSMNLKNLEHRLGDLNG